MMNWWWTDDELMMNWWWTDDELMMNWSGLPKTTTYCHWLIGSTPLNSQSYIRGLDGWDGWDVCITDSTYYKSTASGAKKFWFITKPRMVKYLNQDDWNCIYFVEELFLCQVDWANLYGVQRYIEIHLIDFLTVKGSPKLTTLWNHPRKDTEWIWWDTVELYCHKHVSWNWRQNVQFCFTILVGI